MTVAQSSAAINNSYMALGQCTSPGTTSQVAAVITQPETDHITQKEASQPDFQYYQRFIFVVTAAGPQTFVRTLSDTYTASESMIKKAILARADTYSNSESILKKAILAHLDSMSKSESLIKKAIHLLLSDTYSKSETLTKKAILSKSDTYSKSESLVKKVTHSLSDTLGKSESLSKIAQKIRTLSVETYGKSESITKRAILRSIDSLGNSESLTAARSFIRSLSDSYGKSESISIRVRRFISDTYGSSESLRKTVSTFLTDTYSRSESLIRIKTFVKTLSDTYGNTETLVKKSTKVIQETYGRSESLVKIRTTVRALSDTYGKSESLSTIYRKFLAETYAATEQLRKRAIKLLSETYLASESLTSDRIVPIILRTLEDTYTAGELLTKTVIHYITDVIGGAGGYKHFIHYLNETYSASETLTSFVIRGMQSGIDAVQSRIQEIAQNVVKITVQGRQSMQAPRQPLSSRIPTSKTVVRTLTDSYPASESIQTNVYRERVRVIDAATTVHQQLPAAAEQIIQTIVKTIKDKDPEAARVFEQRMQVKENMERELRVITKLQETIKVVNNKDNNPESRMLKSKKLRSLMKLTKLIDLIRKIGDM